MMTQGDLYRTIYSLLVDAYGEPTWRRHLPPVDELVSTILSQATADVNRDRGFRGLRARFAGWEAVMDAPVEEVVEAIRPAGLANQKAPRIQGALRAIVEERREMSLDFLAEMPLGEARDWLTGIKGVGRKTASIVLLFSFGLPAFPVDTHVHRILRRVGLIGERVSAERAHGLIEEMADPDTFYAMHLNLIRHGREVCQARGPRCAVCVLQEHCAYYGENHADE